MDRKQARLTKLRKRAAHVLETSVPDSDHQSALDTAVLIQELRIHQIELELQLDDIQQAYLALEKSQQRCSRLFEEAPIAYFIISSSGSIIASNTAANQLLGLDADAIRDKIFTEFVVTDFQDVYYFYWRSTKAEGNNKSCELELQTKDGSRVPVLLNSSATETASTETLLAVSNLSAIKGSDAALARASELAKEVNQQRLKILSVIAPEFRRPLATILSSVNLLHKHGKRLTEKKRDQLYATIQNLVWYLNDSVQDARNIKELERNQLFRMEAFDVLAFTRQIITDMEVIAEERKIALEILAEQEQVNIIWNLNLYRRIVMNLLGNLLRFTNKSIRCQLDVKDTSFTLRLDVQTTSLLEDEIDFLFQAFYEGHTNEFVQGRGNGLLIAYHTIQLHGGSIRHKAYEGGGISFLIELPKLQANPSPYRH